MLQNMCLVRIRLGFSEQASRKTESHALDAVLTESPKLNPNRRSKLNPLNPESQNRRSKLNPLNPVNLKTEGQNWIPWILNLRTEGQNWISGMNYQRWIMLQEIMEFQIFRKSKILKFFLDIFLNFSIFEIFFITFHKGFLYKK